MIAGPTCLAEIFAGRVGLTYACVRRPYMSFAYTLFDFGRDLNS